jgi:cell division protein FtsN
MARRNRKPKRTQPAPGWVWMLSGLAIGLVVAAGVYFRRVPSPAEHVMAAERGSAAPAERAPARRGAPARGAAGSNGDQPKGDAAKASDQHFDFYDILPQYEVVVPEVETAAGPSARAKPIDEPGSYVLQAGSFGSAGEADKLRANLALLGIESRVQRVTIDDDVYHRVRIGPISDLEKLNRIRRQLRDAHVNAMLMKVPP